MGEPNIDFARAAFNACQNGTATKQQQQSVSSRVILLHADVGDLRRILKGWLDWHRFATAEDECEYLNGKGWDDAEALASSTMGKIAALEARWPNKGDVK